APARYTLSLHDALPISPVGVVPARGRRCLAHALRRAAGAPAADPGLHRAPRRRRHRRARTRWFGYLGGAVRWPAARAGGRDLDRSEEHTSELQSRENLV